MGVFVKTSPMPVSAKELFAWHARPGAFDRLVPPWEQIEIVGGHPGIENGAQVRLRLRQGPLTLSWVAEHRDVEPGRGFVDEQISGPFSRWIHHHRFTPAESEAGSADHTTAAEPDLRASVLEDRVEYALPFGFLAERIGGRRVRAQLERTFTFRHHRTRQDLARHRLYAGDRPLTVAVTGAGGLVGSALIPFLTTGGHTAVPLVRRSVRAKEHAISWDPARGRLDPETLEGMDAVVHLAGANIAEGRWSETRKEEIRRSRVDSTALLARTLAGLAAPPRVLVVASGVGYYGEGADPRDESAPPGAGFLPAVASAVEAATRPARDAGIRVVVLRIGIVLSLRGGLLGRLVPFFRLGAGMVLGSGRQPLSWISRDDLVGAIHLALFDPAIEGPVNVVAPEPTTQAEFARALGRVMNRQVLFRVPDIVVRKGWGEMGEAVLLKGTAALPRRLADAGFVHAHPELESALCWELGAF